MVVLFLEFDLAANLDGANAVRCPAIFCLMVEGRPSKIEPESRQRRVRNQCVDGLLIAGNSLRISVVSALDL